MSTIFSKGLAKLTPGSSVDQAPQVPDDRDFIRTLNYEELETKYQIRKYYPRFIHNFDYSTPQIKEMISDKPIYSKANRSKSKAKAVSSKRTTEFDAITGEMITNSSSSKNKKSLERSLRKEYRREHHQEQKVLKSEHKENRKERLIDRKLLRDQHKQERADEREETRRILRKHLDQRKTNAKENKPFSPVSHPHTHSQQHATRADAPTDMIFRNPFDSTQPTLVAGNSFQGSALAMSRINSSMQDTNSARKSSISGKLKDLVLSKRPVQILGTTMNRTKSFDQTKSGMTSERDAKNNKLRLSENNGRRMSEVSRTYFFFFCHLAT